MSYLHITHKDSVAIITLDLPDEKVNKLNESMMDEFSEFLEELEQNDDLRGAVLISGKKDNFIAGADIDMFQARDTAKEIEQLSKDGHKILNRIAGFSKPIAVAVHGSCMGGGLELSLACHYRVCSDSSKTVFALPEVKLGILPGTGGTQRLPHLIGIQNALPYMLTGKNIYTRQAKRMGLVDEVTHKDAIEKAAIKGVHKISDGKFDRKDKRPFLHKLLEGNPLGRKVIFSQARKKTAGQTKGNYPAPPKIIDAVEYGYKHGLEKGLENETVLFGELGATQESRNLVNLFFGMNASKKVPNPDLVREVKKIGVLGAGLMGSGIAEVSIDKGDYRVLLKDQTIENAAEGEKEIWKSLNEKAQKKIISEFERDKTASRVTGVDSYEGFSSVDLVIEAVFEDLELKQNIVQQIESSSPDHTIFASNTSSLPISKIAEGAQRPENIIGMHYFSPVQKMPLLEIITTDQTADWVTQTAYQVGVNQGKNVIVVNDGPGFYTTRILAPYMNEALVLLDEGASIEFLDKIMKDYGYPVGPMALLDEVGFDVGAHVAETMGPKFAERGVESSNKADELLDAGYRGRKNKRGMYKYNSGKKKEVNTEIYEYFGGSSRTNRNKETAQQRMALTMINEAAWCLEEGILKSPEDGDLGAILGLGFPPFLGGPFRYIDQTGVQKVVDQLNEFTEKFGPRFKPAQILVDYAKEGKRFYGE
ncbi:MAG: fatty acid oxidation complex subunit alpha FadJ [Gracilimonas sp.]|uniref:fatty acid oxidation complex subunit alpha FadJ n=1 Tax=Gracilimonas TaxID=649462 RepID=UPI001B14BB54|nr:fatty acid oxidation complex subunit alpha FadJ [Gracilimonas sp.]MBO6585028.1 fatty acid oxidation complex subunit alpha FadJ [Gracilimonas sp.]MBO6615701.1 fatty acid oxidation complex subunit alpha FadJ [Gracilimonas sp.]